MFADVVDAQSTDILNLQLHYYSNFERKFQSFRNFRVNIFVLDG
jgi:hypothetical protein